MLSLNKNYLAGLFKAMLLIAAMGLATPTAIAKGVYQTEEDFLNEVFKNEIPETQTLILKGDLRKSVEKILAHPYSGFRIKYWENSTQSAWILEEIGKEKNITFGIAVSNQKVSYANVLTFRETRGWEIRYPAFTEQYIGASLSEERLTKDIDGVSGATLSVWAMTSVVKMALLLDGYIKNEKK